MLLWEAEGPKVYGLVPGCEAKMKVGYTGKPSSTMRLKTLATGGNTLEIRWSFPAADLKKTEQELHQRLRLWWIEHEWFLLTPASGIAVMRFAESRNCSMWVARAPSKADAYEIGRVIVNEIFLPKYHGDLYEMAAALGVPLRHDGRLAHECAHMFYHGFVNSRDFQCNLRQLQPIENQLMDARKR